MAKSTASLEVLQSAFVLRPLPSPVLLQSADLYFDPVTVCISGGVCVQKKERIMLV